MKKNRILKSLFAIFMILCMILASMMSVSAYQAAHSVTASHVVNGVNVTGDQYLYRTGETVGASSLELSSRPQLTDLYVYVSSEYTYKDKILGLIPTTKTATDTDEKNLADYPATYRIFETDLVGDNSVSSPNLIKLQGRGTASYQVGNILYIWGGKTLSVQ